MVVAVALAATARPAPEDKTTMVADASVSATISPGEPSATSETITVAKTGDKIELIVVQTPDGSPPRRHTKAISADAFARVWKIVEAEKLRAFLPEEKPGKVADFGERQLRIEWRTEPGASLQIHHVAWMRPIANAATAKKLQAALGALAHAELPASGLESFPRP